MNQQLNASTGLQTVSFAPLHSPLNELTPTPIASIAHLSVPLEECRDAIGQFQGKLLFNCKESTVPFTLMLHKQTVGVMKTGVVSIFTAISDF